MFQMETIIYLRTYNTKKTFNNEGFVKGKLQNNLKKAKGILVSQYSRRTSKSDVLMSSTGKPRRCACRRSDRFDFPFSEQPSSWCALMPKRRHVPPPRQAGAKHAAQDTGDSKERAGTWIATACRRVRRRVRLCFWFSSWVRSTCRRRWKCRRWGT